MDHLAVAHVHRDMARVGAVGDEVAGLRLGERHLPSGVALFLGGARQTDARLPVRPLHEAGTVESAGPVGAPHVGAAECGERAAARAAAASRPEAGVTPPGSGRSERPEREARS